MNDINIFDSAARQKGEFKKFDAVGDSIQGTYIDAYEAVDSYNNEQLVVVLKDKEGKIWNVGIRKKSTILMDRMKPIKFGQIIGFRFEEERPSKAMPGRMAKIINVYHDPKFVDEVWLAEKKKQDEMFGGTSAPTFTPEAPAYGVTTAPSAAAPVASAVPASTTVNSGSTEGTLAATPTVVQEQARKIAISIGLAQENATPAEIDQKVLEAIGLKVTEADPSELITKLATYQRK